MIKFDTKKLTVAMCADHEDIETLYKPRHVFKSPEDAENFAHHILSELGNRLVSISFEVCGQKVESSGITYDKAKRIKGKYTDAVITEDVENAIKYGLFHENTGRPANTKTFDSREKAYSYWRNKFGKLRNACTGIFVEIREMQLIPERPEHEMIGNLRAGDVVDIEIDCGKWRVSITEFSFPPHKKGTRPFYSFKSVFKNGGVVEFTQDDIVKIVSIPIKKPETFEEFFDSFVKKHETIDYIPKYRLAEIWSLEMARRKEDGLEVFGNPYQGCGFYVV